jgi:hypothetical protein
MIQQFLSDFESAVSARAKELKLNSQEIRLRYNSVKIDERQSKKWCHAIVWSVVVVAYEYLLT